MCGRQVIGGSRNRCNRRTLWDLQGGHYVSEGVGGCDRRQYGRWLGILVVLNESDNTTDGMTTVRSRVEEG